MVAALPEAKIKRIENLSHGPNGPEQLTRIWNNILFENNLLDNFLANPPNYVVELISADIEGTLEIVKEIINEKDEVHGSV